MNRQNALWTTLASSALLLSLACGTATQPPAAGRSPETAMTSDDPHSFSQPDLVTVEHLALSLAVDFPGQRLVGSATLQIDNHAGTDRLVLDTRDLDIRAVTLDTGESTNFVLGAPVEFMGQPLTIAIRPETRWVTIEYASRPEAAALQWLTKEQTAGKQHPFMFSQSQAILARTWVPIQDTPGVRFTYAANVRVPPGLMAVMSAENPQERSPDGLYSFRMPTPIPSYLLAIAAGDLEFRPVGPRSGVYAEPSVVERAAAELVDMPQMMEAAERLYGPYRWGRYDVLILPPSFPFGGMENPRLTFATPTILAGDRSLVALIAHELAHSWSGNLVTNATWDDFWLNEGFTVYFEQRIMEAVYGREYAEMLAGLGQQDLRKEVATLGATSADTRLALSLEGRDPDEGMTDVAYQKGYFFLRRLEEEVGRARFDDWLRQYFDEFAFQSRTTDQFVQYLDRTLLAGRSDLRNEVREWIYEAGIPDTIPSVESQRFQIVEAETQRFLEGAAASSLRTSGWSTHEWLHFIRAIPDDLSQERMAELDAAFHFTRSGNSEILAVWFEQAVASDYVVVKPALDRFLMDVGRRKFLEPLYKALAADPEWKAWAMEVYRRARPGYHSVSYQTIDRILGWSG